MLTILKVRKDYMVFQQRLLIIVKWCTIVDFHTLKGMFLPLQIEENYASLSLFCELGISSHDQFCLEIEVKSWRIKEKQIFLKTVRASKLTWQRKLQINNAHLDR